MASELDEIWALYQDDGGESLRAAEEALETLERAPADREAVAGLFRALHTFKGNSRILGLQNIERVAHLAEDLIGLTRDRGVAFDREIGATLIETVDHLRGMMERAVAARADAGASDGVAVCERLQTLYALRDAPASQEQVYVHEAEPRPEPELVSAPEPEAEFSNGDVVFFDSAAAPIGEDEGYLQIFVEFAGDALAQAQQLGLEATCENFRSVGEAAERLGLSAWREAAEALVAAAHPSARAEGFATLTRLYRGLTGGDFRATESLQAPDEERLAHAVARLIPAAAQPRAFDADQSRAALDIAEAAGARGLFGVADAAETLGATVNAAEYDDALFTLHETMRLWAQSGDAAPVQALAALDRWSLAQGPAALGRLALALTDEPRALDVREIGRHLRVVSGVLAAGGFEDAVALAARCADLVADIEAGARELDAAAVQAFVRFVAALKSMLTGADMFSDVSGRLAQTHAALDALFMADAPHTRATGLGIPEVFLSTLTQEALQSARTAAEDNLSLYTIRADTERRPDIAEPFFAFLSDCRVISTVTRFEDGASLFDFLVASPLSERELRAALAAIDPEGRALFSVADKPSVPAAIPESLVALSSPDPSLSEMFETLGAVVTSQAGARRIAEGLIDLAPEDPAGPAQSALREDLERLALLQRQIGDTLERLQQEVMASQLRPAAALLRKLGETARTQALASGVELEVVLRGQDNLIDGESLARLAIEAPPLVAAAAGFAADGGRVELGLSQSESRIGLTVRLEGPFGSLGAAFAEAAETLRTRGPRTGALEQDANGFRLTLPRSIALMDGMVMRVGAVRYVAPVRAIHRILRAVASDRIKVSAGGGGGLRIDGGAVAPIVRLPRAGADDNGDADLFVIVSESGALAALEIDEILGQEPLLVRPLAGYLGAICAASGYAVLADGAVGVALDLAELIGERRLAA